MKKFFFWTAIPLLILTISNYGIAAADEITPSKRPSDRFSIIYQTTNFNLLTLAEEGNADILLIQTGPPWDTTSNESVLPAIGKTYKKVDMSELTPSLINNYQVVLIVNDQVQSFYDLYKNNYQTFYDYVNSGGTLVFFACYAGWQNGVLNEKLPGEVTVNGYIGGDSEWEFSDDEIVSIDHPIITGELNDNIYLNNNDLDSTCDQTSFGYFSNLPNDTRIIFAKKSSNGQKPTMIEYKIGKGTVLASMNPWEFYYQYYNVGSYCQANFSHIAFDDVFRYAFTKAGGYKIKGVDLANIYPEDNWSTDSRPTTFKHPGDLIDIVAVVTNTTGQEQTANIKLTVPLNAFDTSFTPHVFYRTSAEEIAIKDEKEGEISDVQQENDGTNWTITIQQQKILSLTQPNWNDFVFRLKLINTQQSRNIDATATVYGDNIKSSSRSLSNYNAQVAITGMGKIFLTNRIGMYRRFAENVSQVNQLWETLNKIAGEELCDPGVIYYVDKYDKYYPGLDSSDNPTITWLDYRQNKLPNDYDQDVTTNKEEDKINTTAKVVDSLLKKFIDNSGGRGNGRYVVIVGDDAIIPFYRVFDPTNDKIVKTAENYKITTINTYKAGLNGYLFTDIFYRDWGNTDVPNSFVGRIVGQTPEDMGKFLESSNRKTSNSKRVIKLEIAQFNGGLNRYEKISNQYYDEVIKNIDGTTLDADPDPNPKCSCDDDWLCQTGCFILGFICPDPAEWSDFKKLFTNNNIVPDFDIFRAIAHGSSHGIMKSQIGKQDWCVSGACLVDTPGLFSDTNIIESSTEIRAKFSNFYPFLIFDSCTVGLTDGKQKTFMNAWATVNTRGILAATSVANSGTIVPFNDYFYEYFLETDAGQALNKVERDCYNQGADWDYVKFQMNLYGVPWAKVTPPKKNNNGEAAMMVKNSLNMSRNQNASENGIQQNFTLDASNYSVVTTTDGFSLVIVDGFNLLMQNTQTPVVPFKTFEIDLPVTATINDVGANFDNEVGLGQLNIPAYVPSFLTQDSNANFPSYTPSPTDIGIFPSAQYNYRIVNHGNNIRVFITVYPVSFDSMSHETKIYKSISVTVDFTSPAKGFIRSFSANKDAYTVSESIETNATIENTFAESINCHVNIDIKDYLGNAVTSSSGDVVVNSNASNTAQVNIAAPTIPGSYKIVGTVTEGGSQIGVYEETIKVINARINYFNTPKVIQSGDYGNFEVGIQNLSVNAATAFVDFYVYDGQHQMAKLPQITALNIGQNETRNVQTQWYPFADLPVKYYLVKAVVNINNSTLSTDSQSILLNTNGNQPPVATAGEDQTVQGSSLDGTQVQLDGSNSYDPEGAPLTYTWTWSGGQASGVGPTVTLPVGETIITLTVSDGELTATDEVVITVTAPPCKLTIEPSPVRSFFLLPRPFLKLTITGENSSFDKTSTVNIEGVRSIRIKDVTGNKITARVWIPLKSIIGTGKKQVTVKTGDQFCTGEIEIE
jgi:hypothetical protein